MKRRKREPDLPELITGHIETIARLEEEALAQRTRGERLADAVVRVARATPFIVGQCVVAIAWIAFNAAAVPAWRFDPYPFGLLNLVFAAEAMFLTIFILSKQSRLGHRADRRAHLDLQVNMLSEKEITAALHMLTLIGERLGIDPENAHPEMEVLSANTAVDSLVEQLHDKLPE